MRHDEGFFSGHDNLRLFWASSAPAEPPKAHVVVVHGYQEHVGRYRGVFAALNEAGLAAHGYDFRGHGQSDGRRGHCQRFSHFVEDLDAFIQRIARQAGGKKLFLLAHSHGALTAIHWLKKTGGAGVAGAALTAPYLKLAFTPPRLKVLGARLVGKIIPWLPIVSELSMETLSRDVEIQRAAASDPLYNKNVTPRWFIESNAAQLKALTYGPAIDLPVLMFFGSDDRVTSTAASRQLFDSLASRDKRLKEYPGMRHETLNEIGKEEVLSDLVRWISSRL